MENPDKIEALSEKDREFCVATGSIGLVISFVCLGQLLYLLPFSEWLSWPFFSLFIFCVVAFALLIKKEPAASVCILIGTGLIFLYFGFLVFAFLAYGIFSFSVLALILFLFMLSLTIFIYITELHKRLRLFKRQKMEEGAYWENRV